MIDVLCSKLPSTFCEIDQLAAILLRFCRDHAEHLRAAYDRPELCGLMCDQADALQIWFEEALEEDWLDEAELAAVAARLRGVAATVTAAGFGAHATVVAARAMADALDRSHGPRFAGVFRGRGVTQVAAGDAIPIPHPPLKELFARDLGTNPLRLGPQLHELTWLRLMPDVARGHQVRLDFQHDDVLADLRPDSRIAVIVPCHADSDLCYERTDEPTPRFFGVRPGRPEVQRETILRLLEEAAQGGARIVILPELCIDADGLDAIQEWHARAPHRIAIAVCGSVHCERDGARRNVSTALLPDGARLEHFKFNPFYLALPSAADGSKILTYREDIVTTPSIISIRMCADWSFTTLICKDFLEPGVAQILEDARVRLVLVPACSPKTSVFSQTAGMLATRAQAVVVIANLTAAGATDPSVAIVARPVQRQVVHEVSRAEVSPPLVLFFDLAPRSRQ